MFLDISRFFPLFSGISLNRKNLDFLFAHAHFSPYLSPFFATIRLVRRRKFVFTSDCSFEVLISAVVKKKNTSRNSSYISSRDCSSHGFTRKVITMVTLKKVFDFAKPEYVRTDIVKTDSIGINSDNDSRRNEHQHLLLSTTYSLNSSHTKKIHVGMQAANEDCFVPIVKLSGNYADGICLDIDTWQQFQGSMEDMRQYLCENQ